MTFATVAIGLGTAAIGAYTSNRAASKNASIANRQMDMANRPQNTSLGSYFNPGGTSGLATQGQQMDIIGNLPGYKSSLFGSTNNYLGNLGNISQQLTGSNWFQQLQPDTNQVFGKRPEVGAAPTQAQFTSPVQPVGLDAILQSQYGSGGGFGRPRRSTSGQTTFDGAGYTGALDAYNQSLQAQQEYDQRVASWQAQQGQQGQQGQSGGSGLFGNNGQLFSNDSPFMNSVLNPLKEQQALAQGRLTSDLGRRGVSGSSIANTQMSNQAALFGRQRGDLTTQANMEQVKMMTGLNDAAINAATGYVSNLSKLDAQAQQQLAQVASQELAMLGMNSTQISQMMQAAGLQMQSNTAASEGFGRALMAGGSIMSGYQQPTASPMSSTTAGFNANVPWR